MTSIAEVSRRLAVMSELNGRLDGLNATQEKCGLPSIESMSGADEVSRLAQIEGLLNHIRGSLALGETNAVVVYCLAAQMVAWCIALEERDEARVP